MIREKYKMIPRNMVSLFNIICDCFLTLSVFMKKNYATNFRHIAINQLLKNELYMVESYICAKFECQIQKRT